ncbi:glyoxalase [Planctomonas sp. JC2975]|uniref:VOC family protein n=1 Tax=Planctomonas sp. JC2975 TaxID=2729626 RepID=UPI001472D11E|nr:VOC family protein [Planctomonas sp. JC2975]NNC13513.1 glyoxalase [Planctomonas sp. JC2975]
MSESIVTGILTVAIPTADADTALRFYTDVLGLTLERDLPASSTGPRWVTLGTGGPVSVSLWEPPAGADSVPRPTGIRFVTPDAADARQRIAASGAEVGELLQWPGVPAMFDARDLEGNEFVVMEALPRG